MGDGWWLVGGGLAGTLQLVSLHSMGKRVPIEMASYLHVAPRHGMDHAGVFRRGLRASRCIGPRDT
ncbi:hypothetical protein JIR001_10420 [Polycladomyces abyssicola]|uniref:Uncharacterized protein n=1 Tax=Polycladomyces abyssicola TaxID=1125966 RepID=A0A8D5UDW8_9BACL|nr:hypothetical protein JIR001_10420 [Polycladomyces abyssicola]